MPSKYTHRFSIDLERNWSWHIGISFCIEPKDISGTRDIYLFLMLGCYDLSIGYLSWPEDDEYAE